MNKNLSCSYMYVCLPVVRNYLLLCEDSILEILQGQNYLFGFYSFYCYMIV